MEAGPTASGSEGMKRWIVSVKPAEPGSDGPYLVSDHPEVVRAVIAAINSQWRTPTDPGRHLQVVREPQAIVAHP